MSSSSDYSDRHERFLRLFLSSERELFRYVSVLVPSIEDAAEIVQEAALQLWKKFDDFDVSQPFTPWACRFGLIVAHQWMARRQRWAAILEPENAERLLSRRAELMPDFDRRFAHLESCIEKLTPEQRSLLQGYYWAGDEIVVLAHKSEQSVEAIYKSLQRIRQKLRTCIEAATRLGASKS
jgi:RNA polymerase sigma-70 factor (ECF subfamily)